LEDDAVEFLWKDYSHRGKQKSMKLKAVEFIRRFLLHVLPSGFVRIRHYGFLANRSCREKLALCRVLLDSATGPESVIPEPGAEPERAGEAETKSSICPSCRRGQMVIIETIQAEPMNQTGRRRDSPLPRPGLDSS
jgi:hypothetical protein